MNVHVPDRIGFVRLRIGDVLDGMNDPVLDLEHRVISKTGTVIRRAVEVRWSTGMD